MPQIQISPEQIPQAIAQYKAELGAIEEILDIKAEILRKYDMMEAAIEDGRFSEAAILFIDCQKIEYSLTVRGLAEKKNQLVSILEQLESPIARANAFPPSMPAKGFRTPRV